LSKRGIREIGNQEMRDQWLSVHSCFPDSLIPDSPSHLGVKPGIARLIEAQMDQVQGEKEAHEGKDRG